MFRIAMFFALVFAFVCGVSFEHYRLTKVAVITPAAAPSCTIHAEDGAVQFTPDQFNRYMAAQNAANAQLVQDQSAKNQQLADQAYAKFQADEAARMLKLNKLAQKNMHVGIIKPGVTNSSTFELKMSHINRSI